MPSFRRDSKRSDFLFSRYRRKSLLFESRETRIFDRSRPRKQWGEASAEPRFAIDRRPSLPLYYPETCPFAHSSNRCSISRVTERGVSFTTSSIIVGVISPSSPDATLCKNGITAARSQM